MYYLDNTFLIILPGILVALFAQYRIKSTYSRYSEVMARSGFTGARVARDMLDAAGLGDVPVNRVQGTLTDHYDPIHRTLNLSESVYGSSSIAALGVAAHECGHALQHLEGYEPLKLRSAVVPTVNIGSSLSWPIFLAGMISGWRPLLLAGVMLFSLTVLFSLITLPVEFNASRRAMAALEGRGYLSWEELDGAKKVLNAAALTYVAAALSAILNLLRLLVLARRSDRD
ncbi:MAG: zinc metallopeptidase [Clostridiales bacterium]|nr:zinc metallopeptidase [Bacillota bacterium]NLL55222.1 zinc metallopeptidase [Clostridiales bacterium]